MKAKIVCLAMGLFLSAVAVRGADTNEYSDSTNRWHGGSYDGWDRHAMTNAVGLGGALVTLSSGTNQAFDWTQTAAALAALTIAVEDPGGVITNGGTLRVGLPAAFWCRFNTNSAVTYSGSAASKAGAAIFADAGRTVRIPVITNFAAADILIVSGLALTDLQLAGPVAVLDRLALDVEGDGTWDVVDLYTVELRAPLWPGGAYDGWDRDAMSGYRALNFQGTFFMVR